MKKVVLIFCALMLFTSCEWFEDIGEPDIAEGTIDLDTTYFPFGLGYEWGYQGHKWGHDYTVDPAQEWDTVYTYTVKVIDSFWNSDTLFFQLEGGFIDTHNPVKIWTDSIIAGSWWWGYWDTICVVNPDTTRYYDIFGGFGLFYEAESLKIGSAYDPSGVGGELYSTEALRLKEIGVVLQSYEYEDAGYSNYWDAELLYFYNGTDTVYQASQSEP